MNQWDVLLEFANNKGYSNPYLVLESAWRVPNWALMKDALSQVGGGQRDQAAPGYNTKHPPLSQRGEWVDLIK